VIVLNDRHGVRLASDFPLFAAWHLKLQRRSWCNRVTSIALCLYSLPSGNILPGYTSSSPYRWWLFSAQWQPMSDCGSSPILFHQQVSGLTFLIIFFGTNLKKKHSTISITTKRSEFFYWATVLATFEFWYCSRYMTANFTLKLGYFNSGILLAVLFALSPRLSLLEIWS